MAPKPSMAAWGFRIFTTFEIMLILQAVVKGVNSFDTTVKTEAGTVWGFRKHVPELEKDIEVYLGVQYAEAPVGSLRFKDPIALPLNQSKSLGRQSFAPSCPQMEFGILKLTEGLSIWKTPEPFDEDCLYLNIWKPHVSNPVGNGKPVIVWIHGGGFNFGSSSVKGYDGSHLAAWTDSVVVSVQYRLGALGFLYTGDDFAPGNAGLKDQVLALEWVRQHIDKFGGDRDKITIIGESAGSASVGFHLLSPKTSKLFKRAVLLSGTPNADWALVQPSEAWKRALELARSLGADASSYDDVKRHLLNRKWREIVDAQGKDEANFVFVPTVETSLVPEHPVRLLENAKHLNGKELIVSWTKDEGSMFLAFELKRLKKIQKATDIPVIYREDFVKIIGKLVGSGDRAPDEVVSMYIESADKPYLKGLTKCYGDVLIACPTNQFVQEARSRGGKVYQAEYNHRPKKSALPEWMGVAHASDQEMLFVHPFFRKDRYDDEDRFTCRIFLDRLKEFVHKGSPNSASETSWSDNQMFVISSSIKDVDNRTSTCSKLRKLIPNYISGSISVHPNFLRVLAVLAIFLQALGLIRS